MRTHYDMSIIYQQFHLIIFLNTAHRQYVITSLNLDCAALLMLANEVERVYLPVLIILSQLDEMLNAWG